MAIQAAATMASDFTLTMPIDDGTTSQFLQTDGNGVLTWANPLVPPLTTRGDLIRGGVAGAAERFAAVTNNTVVRGNGTDVVSGQIDDPGFFTTGAAAGNSAIGIVTTAAQTFAGEKTFRAPLIVERTGVPTQFAAMSGGDAGNNPHVSTNAGGALELRAVAVRAPRTGTPSQFIEIGGGDAGLDPFITSNSVLNIKSTTIQINGLKWITSGGPVITTSARTADADCAAGACILAASQYGGGIATINFVSTGIYDVGFTASFWATAPNCTVVSYRGSTIYMVGDYPTTTTWRVRSFDGSTASNNRFGVVCTGNRL